VTLAKLVVLSIKYIYESNHRVTNITYGVVAIIKKIRNYRNDQLAVNTYYQALRELKELSKADTESKTISITRNSKRIFTLDHTWYNIKNLWKGKKKAETEETKESEEWFHISLPSPSLEDLFKEVLLKPVFNSSELEEELLEFGKRRNKRMSEKNLAQYLLKNLHNLLEDRE